MDDLLVNIGCGSTWHPAWVNLDLRPVSPQVRSWDVAGGLPFGDAEVQACYASHVLEHLSRPQAKALLNVLQQNVTQYESAFGEIHLEPQAPGGSVQ